MRPFTLLLVLFVTVPLVEIYVLVAVGSHIGALATVALVVLTAVTGVALLRLQGLATLDRVQQALEQGELPARPMLEGLLLLVAGALLLTPGFVTDAVGFALLVPAVRRSLARHLLDGGWLRPGLPPPPAGGPRTLEGEYRREDD